MPLLVKLLCKIGIHTPFSIAFETIDNGVELKKICYCGTTGITLKRWNHEEWHGVGTKISSITCDGKLIYGSD